MDRDEADDFTSQVMERLLLDDCAILRAFDRRSRLQTYLSVVIQRMLFDHYNARKGRYRPSAAAKRHGQIGVDLEKLVHGGSTFREASQILMGRRRVGSISMRDIARIHDALAPRFQRIEVGESHLSGYAAPSAADDQVLQREAGERAGKVRKAIAEALHSMPEDDRQILDLLFWKGLSYADTARSLGIPQKPLYSRVERLLRAMLHRLRELSASDKELHTIMNSIASEGLTEELEHLRQSNEV